MRKITVDFSKGFRKRKRGRPHGPSAKGDFMRWVVDVLMPHAERQLKQAGVWDFRKEAERQVLSYLTQEGYSVNALNIANTRRRGRKRVEVPVVQKVAVE